MIKIGILTSGGDAPGMNAAIRACVRSGLSLGLEVYGVFDGYEGLVNNNIRKLERGDVSGIIIQGGTVLGSARLEDFKLESVRQRGVDNLNALISAIKKQKPATAKGQYIKKVCIASTMGAGVALDRNALAD